METLPEVRSRHLTFASAALLALAITLLLWRYVGINHDGVLYLGQALVRRWPGIYGNDLVFVHGGGQERYTLFPLLLNAAFNWFSPPRVFLWGALASLLAFAGAGWYCLRNLLPETQRAWAWLGVLTLPSGYGMVSIFSYREQFFTPRPIAEALCLIGIGLLASRRLLPAMAVFALAGMFHPLQTIAVALIAWPWAVLQDRRWLHALWITVPIVGLALMGVAPFRGLFQSLDPQWLFALHEATHQLFITTWSARDFHVLGFDIFILALAWRGLPGAFGSWCAAALVGIALGFAANLLLADGLHLVLPAGLQLWRVHWLAHFFAMAAIGTMLFRDFKAHEASRALLLALIALLVWIMSHWAWIPLAMLYAAWPSVPDSKQVRLKPMLGWAFGIGLALLFAYFIALELLPFRIAHNRMDLYAIDRRILAFPLVALGLPLLGLHVWARSTQKGRWILFTCILCPLAAIGAARWDSRSPIIRTFEQTIYRPDLFGVTIPEPAQVYWAQHVLVGPWLSLRRASYFSPHQISGQVFNRALALDGGERLKRMRPLIEEDLYCQDRSVASETRKVCHISDDTMRITCASGPNLRPDFLVLPYKQPQRALGTWVIMDPVEKVPAITYWLYSCAEVMEDLQSASDGIPAGTMPLNGH